MTSPHDVDVIAPNFKQRLSGVTSTIIQLVPIQRKLGLKIAACGPGLPKSLAHLAWWKIPGLLIRPADGKNRVWHSRRNTEMVGGLILKYLFRAPLRLLFTSASQRSHKWFTKWLINRMDFVVATSSKTSAYLTVPNQVIMHGIDLQRFCPVDDQAAAKSALGMDPDAKLIGCFGRIRRQKGTDLFVDAMIKLLPNRPGWKAIIAGRTTAEHTAFEQELRRKIEHAGLGDRILFVGEHTDIEKWYQILSLYIAPQRWEGFGLTPLEAMACGVPVVASDVGAFSELIVQGQTGMVVPRDDVNALIDAANPFLDDESHRELSSKKSLAHVQERFPLEREAKQLIAVYEELLGRSVTLSQNESQSESSLKRAA